jgi:hypothetical protein
MGLSDISRFSILFTQLTMLWLGKARLISGPLFQNLVGGGWGAPLSICPSRRRKTEKSMFSIRRLSHPMILCQHRILCRWMYHRVR